MIRELGGKSRAGDPNAEEGSTISSSECQRGVHMLDFRSTLRSFARTVREAGRESKARVMGRRELAAKEREMEEQGDLWPGRVFC